MGDNRGKQKSQATGGHKRKQIKKESLATLEAGRDTWA